MLFRADFVKQRHVPGSIETNHGSLSKIIGNCWRQLPLDEKRVWERRAKEEKEKHKLQYPDYRFRPVHNKNKNKDKSGSAFVQPPKKEKPQQTREEELRCDQVAALLLEGKKGEELAQAMRSLDRQREAMSVEREGTMSARGSFSSVPYSAMASPMPGGFLPLQPQHSQYAAGMMLRRPSSVPLPHLGDGWSPSAFSHPQHPMHQASIAIPQIPYISHTLSRPTSPIYTDAYPSDHQQRLALGMHLSQRRPSSVGPIGRRSWTMPVYGDMITHGVSMPFFTELGIDNPFANQDQATTGMETAGEPVYSLFNDFSFGGQQQMQQHQQQESQPPAPVDHTTGSPYAIVAPHDLPPLDLEHAGWAAGQLDHTLDANANTNGASISAPPSASVSGSSHASSPEPAEYTPTSTGAYTNAPVYNGMAISPFDMPLDPLSHMGMHPHQHAHPQQLQQHHMHMQQTYVSENAYMTESYDGYSGCEGIEMGMGGGGMIHAPKPITPTSSGATAGGFQDQQDGLAQQQQQQQYFEPVVYADEYAM